MMAIKMEYLSKPINPAREIKQHIYHYSLEYTAISIKVVHKQSGKVEYQRERLLRIAKNLMNFHSDSQQPFALVFDFSALLHEQP
jgi:hypothetical protein